MNLYYETPELAKAAILERPDDLEFVIAALERQPSPWLLFHVLTKIDLLAFTAALSLQNAQAGDDCISHRLAKLCCAHLGDGPAVCIALCNVLVRLDNPGVGFCDTMDLHCERHTVPNKLCTRQHGAIPVDGANLMGAWLDWRIIRVNGVVPSKYAACDVDDGRGIVDVDHVIWHGGRAPTPCENALHMVVAGIPRSGDHVTVHGPSRVELALRVHSNRAQVVHALLRVKAVARQAELETVAERETGHWISEIELDCATPEKDIRAVSPYASAVGSPREMLGDEAVDDAPRPFLEDTMLRELFDFDGQSRVRYSAVLEWGKRYVSAMSNAWMRKRRREWLARDGVLWEVHRLNTQFAAFVKDPLAVQFQLHDTCDSGYLLDSEAEVALGALLGFPVVVNKGLTSFREFVALYAHLTDDAQEDVLEGNDDDAMQKYTSDKGEKGAVQGEDDDGTQKYVSGKGESEPAKGEDDDGTQKYTSDRGDEDPVHGAGDDGMQKYTSDKGDKGPLQGADDDTTQKYTSDKGESDPVQGADDDATQKYASDKGESEPVRGADDDEVLEDRNTIMASVRPASVCEEGVERPAPSGGVMARPQPPEIQTDTAEVAQDVV